MAKNPGNTESAVTPFDAPADQPASEYLGHFLPDQNAEPVSMKDVREQAGLPTEQIAAEDLVDRSFLILAAKPFDSSFKAQDHAYYCVIRLDGESKNVATVLGGAAVVETLDVLIRTGLNRPLQVTLRHVQGGKYGGYYTVE